MTAPDEYLALREKVDGFASAVGARRADQMQCGKGCTACCEVALSVSEVEASALREALSALPSKTHEALRERAAARADADERGERLPCVMLDADGGCAVYEARPLICRTQGLPLSYPEGTIPVETVMARGGDREITWCPLNFETDAPLGEDVIDASRIQEILALVNRRYCDQSGIDPLERIELFALAAADTEAR